jgi:serine/threonine protein kinase
LAKTLGHWTEGSAFFLVQEHIQGDDLEAFAAKLKPKERMYRLTRIFRDVASAVSALHGINLILGRLTSQEVIVDSMGMPKVVYDALAFDDKSVGRMKGRVALMNTVASVPPEELKGKAATPQSDVYALGAMMYSIYAGTSLVSVANYDDAVRTVCAQMPDPPSHYNPEISSALDGIVLGALERDPAKRTPSMAEMAKSLSALLETMRAMTTRSIAIK